MGIQIGKQLALTTYCLARQGERSIDFALSSSAKHWGPLREYYDHDRLKPLHGLLEELQRLHRGHRRPYARDRLGRITPGWVVSYPFRVCINRWRGRWSFSAGEGSFIIDTIARLVSTLACETKPVSDSLIDLRMDLHLCEVIIEHRLVGVAMLKQAANIEHFCQADHIASVSLAGITDRATD